MISENYIVKKHNHSKDHNKRRKTRSSETSSNNSDVDKDLRETDAIAKEICNMKSMVQLNMQDSCYWKQNIHQWKFDKSKLKGPNRNLYPIFEMVMTCLKLSRNYLHHMEKGLSTTDSGIIYYTNMYDILKAEDRRELIAALLRLICCADAVKLTKT